MAAAADCDDVGEPAAVVVVVAAVVVVSQQAEVPALVITQDTLADADAQGRWRDQQLQLRIGARMEVPTATMTTREDDEWGS